MGDNQKGKSQRKDPELLRTPSGRFSALLQAYHFISGDAAERAARKVDTKNRYRSRLEAKAWSKRKIMNKIANASRRRNRGTR